MDTAIRITLVLAVLASSAALAADPAPVPPHAQVRQSLSDEQIATILQAYDQREIAVAKVLLDRSKDARIKSYAQTVLDDHTALLSDTEKWMDVRTMGLDSTPQGIIENDADNDRSTLGKLDGAALDRRYLEVEVVAQQKVLDLIEKQLQFDARNPEVKGMVDSLRDKARAHLEAARALSGSLNSSVG